jgi:antibiotic biosynthesis monooxygenase (ABM) superfamily enzyme
MQRSSPGHRSAAIMRAAAARATLARRVSPQERLASVAAFLSSRGGAVLLDRVSTAAEDLHASCIGNDGNSSGARRL